MKVKGIGLTLLAVFALEACKIEAPKRPSFSKVNKGKQPVTEDSTPGQTPETGGLNLSCGEDDTRRGLRSWRRLSHVEIKNTVADAFQIKVPNMSAFPSDIPKKELFDTMSVTSNHLTNARFLPLESFAEDVAKSIDLKTTFPCLSDGATCVSKQLPVLLQKAWRRPSEKAEVDRLSKLFSALRADGMSAEDSVRSALTAVVLSHHFLYRSELGVKQEDDTYQLNDYEIASALSYTLWRRPPDSSLMALAEKGGLNDSKVIRGLATKMMDDPKAREAWQDFGSQWLDGSRIVNSVKKDAPDFTPAVKEKMKEESRLFIAHTMFDKPAGTFKDLLTSAEHPADPLLDTFYGSESSGKISKYEQEERQGLLGQVSFLASHATDEMANPITRGAFVAERLLCEQFIGAPPTTAPIAEEGKSAKDIFLAKTKAPACQSCHKSIDSLGFALGNFDHLGRYQAKDNGQDIDTSGTFMLDGEPVSFHSPQDLSEAIASSTQGQVCFARQVFNYGFGRKEYAWRPVAGWKNQPPLSAQGKSDLCEIESAAAAMMASGGELKSVIIELLASPAFRIRVPGKPEAIK